jgi:hypothetical protein
VARIALVPDAVDAVAYAAGAWSNSLKTSHFCATIGSVEGGKYTLPKIRAKEGWNMRTDRTYPKMETAKLRAAKLVKEGFEAVVEMEHVGSGFQFKVLTNKPAPEMERDRFGLFLEDPAVVEADQAAEEGTDPNSVKQWDQGFTWAATATEIREQLKKQQAA